MLFSPLPSPLLMRFKFTLLLQRIFLSTLHHSTPRDIVTSSNGIPPLNRYTELRNENSHIFKLLPVPTLDSTILSLVHRVILTPDPVKETLDVVTNMHTVYSVHIKPQDRCTAHFKSIKLNR